MTVKLMASKDDGKTWGIHCNTVSGDVGMGVDPGAEKHIIWDAAADYPNISRASFKFKVIAYEGNIPPILEEFVYVSGGTFTMGNTLGRGNDNELPPHKVTLSPYLIGRYEVTQSQWRAIMGSIPSTGYGLGGNYPVYQVSWYAILKYCNLRSMAEGLTPAYTIDGSTNPDKWGSIPASSDATWDAVTCDWEADGYRLPTEAEWEFAARGGKMSKGYLYSGSNDPDSAVWHKGNSGGKSQIVGNKAANELDIHDMSGNVWEWCWDWYTAYSDAAQVDPRGPATGTERLLRGGSWYGDVSLCRISLRDDGFPYKGHHNHGLRLCRAAN